MPVALRVRKEWSADHSHEHIAGVCVDANAYYTRAQVVAGLDALQTWYTRGRDGSVARIKKIATCPYCSLTPYITTAPDHTVLNNLDNLPPC